MGDREFLGCLGGMEEERRTITCFNSSLEIAKLISNGTDPNECIGVGAARLSWLPSHQVIVVCMAVRRYSNERLLGLQV